MDKRVVLFSSDTALQMNCNGKIYEIGKKPIPVLLNMSETVVQIREVENSARWSFFRFVLLIFGLILAPAIQMFLIFPPKFYDGLSPILLNGTYSLKMPETADSAVFVIDSSSFDGKTVRKPVLHLDKGELKLQEEKCTVNHKGIRDNTFYGIYSICFRSLLSIAFVVLMFVGVSDLTVRILLLAFLTPLLLLSLLTTGIGLAKHKKHLAIVLSALDNQQV